MNGFDVQLVAAIFAAVFWNTSTIYMQKKWRIYDVFVGKKNAQTVHGLLIGFAWLQVAVVSIFVTRSSWAFGAVLPLGLLIIAGSIWIFITALKDIGSGSLVNSNFFGKKLHTSGELYKKLKHPTYISYVMIYVGLGISFGQYGYILAAASLVIGLSVLAFVEKPVTDKNIHKHK
jgi:protein-S-isoprenylcysteine O-methyltransferase Ste14